MNQNDKLITANTGAKPAHIAPGAKPSSVEVPLLKETVKIPKRRAKTAGATAAAKAKRPAASPKQKPASKSYEDNPQNEQAILDAAAAIPVKDYGDYDVTVESKTSYDDALFDIGDDLDKALEQIQAEKEQAAEQAPSQDEKPQAQETEQVAPGDPRKSAKVYNFEPFLAATDNDEPNTDDEPQGLNLCVFDNTQDFSRLAKAGEPLLIEGTSESATDTTDNVNSEKSADEDSAPKTLAEKIKRKAKQQFDKSKANFDEYIGRSLPDRTLPLEFTLPLQKNKKDSKNAASQYAAKKLFEDKGKSIFSMMRQADSDLAALSKQQMLAPLRHSVLDGYAEYLIKKTQEAIQSFERKPNLSGDSKRLALAEHNQSALRALILGYKQIYSSYYEAANVVYGPQRNSANKVLFQIFNLLLLECQLCFALHTKPAASSIKAMNKLFAVARLYEPQQISLPQISLLNELPTSLKAIYFHYQVLLCLHSQNISSLLYKVLHPYLEAKLAYLQLIDPAQLNQNEPLKRETIWAISHDQNTPAALGQPLTGTTTATTESDDSSESSPVTLIDVSEFFYAIRYDYAQCLETLSDSQDKHPNPIMAGIKPHYRINLLAALNSLLNQHESCKRPPLYSSYQASRYRSYSSFEQLLAHFQFSYAMDTRRATKPGEEAPELPKKPKADKGQWLATQGTGDQLQLQIVEENSEAKLDIGQPLLLIQSDDPKQTPEPLKDDEGEGVTLGLITQLERSQAGKLDVQVLNLGAQSTQAQLAIPGEPDAKRPPIPVLLGLGQHGLVLIADYKRPLPKSAILTLPDGQERDAKLSRPLFYSPKVQVWQVS